MPRQQNLKHRLQTLGTLQDAVGAMRSLSAHHFRRARSSLNAARAYRAEMNAVLAEIGVPQNSNPDLPTGLLIIGSDLGLCGDYNSRLHALAIAEVGRLRGTIIYSIGRRGRGVLAKSGLIPRQSYDAPASLEGLTRLLSALSQDILEDYLAHVIGGLQVVSAAFQGVGQFTPGSSMVLPFRSDEVTQPLRRSPYVDSTHLTTVAVREYLYISLYETLLDALAAEHGMRLMAAEAALEWLEGTAASAAHQLATARSEASTQELLDIVTGSKRRRSGEPG